MAPRGQRNTSSTAEDAPEGSNTSGGPQPASEPTNATLADKLEAARRRIAELEEEVHMRNELQAMEAQIHQLESANTPVTTPAETQRGPVVPPVVYPVRRAPKTRELSTYKGKTIKEAQDFFYQAELKWREDGDVTWDTDAAKVTHCVSCFEGIARDIWKRKERSVGVDNTSWEDFVEFMKNAISDPENREIDASTRYREAVQRPNQSVQSFVSYLDSLEDDLGCAGDSQSRNNLLSRLRPEIREEISRQGNVPRDRESLIALAVRIENHWGLFRGKQAHRNEPAGHQKGKDIDHNKGENRIKRERSRSPQRESSRRRFDSVTTGANNTPTTGTRERNNAVCYRCKKEGHYANACPTHIVCFNCKKPGHKSWSCPEPRRQPGNGNPPQ
jgi:hypothetical protein